MEDSEEASMTDEEILAEYEADEEEEEEEDAFERNDLRTRRSGRQDDDYALKTTEELRQTKKAMDLFEEVCEEKETWTRTKKRKTTSDLDDYEDVDEVDFDYAAGRRRRRPRRRVPKDDEYDDEHEYDDDDDDERGGTDRDF